MRPPPPPSRARRGAVDAFLGPDEGPVPPPMAAHSLCHEDCWQWRNLCGGKGRQRGHSRSVSQRTEPDPVRPSQHQLSVAQHRRHTLPIILCLFPHVHQPGRLLHEEVLGTAWRIDLAGFLSYVSPPPGFRLGPGLANTLVGSVYVLWIV